MEKIETAIAIALVNRFFFATVGAFGRRRARPCRKLGPKARWWRGKDHEMGRTGARR